MSYTKTQWNNDTAPAINETNLNKIEQGIYDNDSAITTINTNIGDLSDLETTTQTDIVSAINELEDNKATKDVATMNRNGLMSSADYTKLDAMAINNTYGTSTTEAYSQSYSNNTFASKNIENYSTDETIIGTWIDGKTLYRKVITTTVASGTTSAEVNINVQNFGYVIKADVRFNSVGNADYVYGAYYSGATDYMRFFMRNNMLQIRLGSNSNGFNIVAILEYTKTTN